MKIGILETGRPPEELQDKHGGYPDMFRRMLNAAAPHFDFTTFSVLDDQFPSSPQDCHGWIVTGSRHGVYENLPWMARLKDFLREAVAAKKPIIGICFGHQILAEAMGGKVEKYDKGWGLGPSEYRLLAQKDWMGEDAASGLLINAIHQDQVVQLPPDAEIIAESTFCRYAALSYGENAISFQAHPEFGSDFLADVIDLRRGKVIPEPLADAATVRLAQPRNRPDSALIARWMAHFLESRCKAEA